MKYNPIRNEQMDENMTELNTSNKDRREYKIKAIWNSANYTNKLEDDPPEFYYLVA